MRQLSPAGRLTHAIVNAINDVPVPRKRPSFDSSDPRWLAAMKLARETGINVNDAYDWLESQ